MNCVMCHRPAIGGVTHPLCRSRYSIDGVFTSLVYKGIVKKLVYTFKYPPYLTDLHEQLVELFYEGVIQKEQLYQLQYIRTLCIPIPLHTKKFRKRGYNQSMLLADGLSKRFAFPVVDGLERIKETKTQVGLSKEARQENIKGAFAVNKKYKELLGEYKQVFLIDDVVTSGSTLREAANVLKRAGVKSVWGLTLAHGE